MAAADKAPEWRLSPKANSDLDDIIEFVGQQSGSVEIVESLLDDIFSALDRLAFAPAIGFLRTEITGHDFRWWPVHRYLILYDPKSKPIQVARILHGSRNLASLLKPDEELERGG